MNSRQRSMEVEQEVPNFFDQVAEIPQNTVLVDLSDSSRNSQNSTLMKQIQQYRERVEESQRRLDETQKALEQVREENKDLHKKVIMIMEQNEDLNKAMTTMRNQFEQMRTIFRQNNFSQQKSSPQYLKKGKVYFPEKKIQHIQHRHHIQPPQSEQIEEVHSKTDVGHKDNRKYNSRSRSRQTEKDQKKKRVQEEKKKEIIQAIKKSKKSERRHLIRQYMEQFKLTQRTIYYWLQE